MKRTLALALLLCLPTFFGSRALCIPLLPEEYTGELAMIKPGTHPKRMVIKFFEAVDKGFSVELGALQESVYEIRFNEQYMPYRFSEYTIEGDLKEQYDRIYNANGVMTGENKRGADRFVQLSSEYTYENPKQAKTLRVQKIYNSEKHLMYTETYQSDKKGNITSMRRTNPKEELVYAYEYIYDENNNLIHETRLDTKGTKVSEEEHEYGSHKELLSDNVYNAKGKLRFRNEYTYNDKNEMTGMTITHASGQVETYRMEYEYDTRGNWIRQTTYKGSKIPVFVIIRDIEY
ncbi:hypothetical protein HDR62_02445 [bacterium]|nr:hypothetical protein [bacterium]